MTGTVKLVSAGGGSVSFVTPSTGSNRTVTLPDADVTIGAKNSDAVLTTQGDILYQDGSGLQRLAPGSSGKYLKTQGAGANPVWDTVTAGYTKLRDKVGVGTGTSYDVTAIPAGVSHVVLLHHLTSFDSTSEHCIRLGHAGSGGTLITSGYYSAETPISGSISPNNNDTRFGGYGMNVAARTYSGIVNLWHLGGNIWHLDWTAVTPQLTASNSTVYKVTGYVPVGATLDRFSYYGHTGNNLDGGEISVYYI